MSFNDGKRLRNFTLWLTIFEQYWKILWQIIKYIVNCEKLVSWFAEDWFRKITNITNEQTKRSSVAGVGIPSTTLYFNRIFEYSSS